MVKFANALIAVTLVAAPVLAFAQEEQTDFVSREVSDFELETREPQRLGGGRPKAGGLRGGRGLSIRIPGGSSRLGGMRSPGLRSPGIRSSRLRSPGIRSGALRSPGIRSSRLRSPAIRSPLRSAGPFSPIRSASRRRLAARDLEDLSELDAREPQSGRGLSGIPRRSNRLGGIRSPGLRSPGIRSGALRSPFRSPGPFSPIRTGARRSPGIRSGALRSPFRSGALRSPIRSASRRLAARDLEDLSELDARELEDLEQREPFFFLAGLAARLAGKGISRAAQARKHRRRDLSDLEDIDARDFEDISDLSTRDLEELEQREPFFFLAGLAAKLAGKGISRAVQARKHRRRDLSDFEDLDARDFDMFEDISERDFTDNFDDLFERDLDASIDELD